MEETGFMNHFNLITMTQQIIASYIEIAIQKIVEGQSVPTIQEWLVHEGIDQFTINRISSRTLVRAEMYFSARAQEVFETKGSREELLALYAALTPELRQQFAAKEEQRHRSKIEREIMDALLIKSSKRYCLKLIEKYHNYVVSKADIQEWIGNHFAEQKTEYRKAIKVGFLLGPVFIIAGFGFGALNDYYNLNYELVASGILMIGAYFVVDGILSVFKSLRSIPEFD